MKLFGRKPSAPVLVCKPDAANMPFFPGPVPTERMAFSLYQCTAAELQVTTHSVKSSASPVARHDVMLQARQTPLEADWALTPEQARELAARLLDAAANCDEAVHMAHALRRD